MPHLFSEFLKYLPIAAKSTYAFISYILLLAVGLYYIIKKLEADRISNEMRGLTKEARLALLNKKYNIYPKVGLAPDQYLRKEVNRYKFIVAIFLIVAIFVIVIVALTLAHKGNDSLTLTVVLHGHKGKYDLLPNIGSVLLDGPKVSNLTSNVNEKGEAYFQNQQIGDTIQLKIRSPQQYAAEPLDTDYVVPPEGKIYLEASLQNNDKISGIVLDGNIPLTGVLVEVDTLKAETGQDGKFTINIPVELRQDEYKVWFLKKGYASASSPAFPQYKQDIQIQMKKLTR